MINFEQQAFHKNEQKVYNVLVIDTVNQTVDLQDLESGKLGLIGVPFDDVILLPYLGVKDKNDEKLYRDDLIKDSDGQVYLIDGSYKDGVFVSDPSGLYLFSPSKFERIGNYHEQTDEYKQQLGLNIKTKQSQSEKCSTEQLMNTTFLKALKIVKSLGVDLNTTGFTVFQPLNDEEGIMVQNVLENGEYTLKILVSDIMICLPKIDNTLDMFN